MQNDPTDPPNGPHSATDTSGTPVVPLVPASPGVGANTSVPETHPIIAREGWGILAALAGAWVLSFFVFEWLRWPLFLLLVFSLQFFRDPRRRVPVNPALALSPADGRVILVTRCPNPYREGHPEALKISVFMNVFNVHSNRAPLAAQVESVQYFPGAFLNAALDKASEANERNVLHLRGAFGQATLVQVAGLVARRILCYARAGEALAQGQRFGFIRFGSRADLYLPPTAQALVYPGDTVTAGITPLAKLGG